MKSLQAFATYYILKKIQPKIVVESGVFKGFSTWLIENTLPNSKIISFDISFANLEYKSQKAEYNEFDISKYDWDKIENKKDVLFFIDDHQNYFKRVKFLYKKGFKHMIAEDNYPFGVGDCMSLKAILNSDLYPADKLDLENILEIYCEFPPVYKTSFFGNKREDVKYTTYNESIFFRATNVPTRWNFPTQKPLYLEYEKEVDLFFREADTYCFLAYVKIK